MHEKELKNLAIKDLILHEFVLLKGKYKKGKTMRKIKSNLESEIK